MNFVALIAMVVVLFVGFCLWFRREKELQECLAAQRKEASRALKLERQNSLQAQAQQRTLFESMVEGVIVLDQAGRISVANQSLKDLLRLTGELRGRTILEAVRVPLLAEMAARLPEQGILRNAELELTGASPQLIEVNASSIIDQQGLYQGAILVFHDLTRLKQLENTRREFVGNVSHELRTPLSLIKGFVETLLDGAKSNPAQAERFLQTILKHTNRLAYLIEDLLTISQLESGPAILSVQPFHLYDVVQRVIEDIRGKAIEREICIENQVPTELEALGDADRLQQVVFNLVENAIKYGRVKGHVSIRTQLHKPTEVEVSVQDDGPGIPEQAQSRVFERFYRVDKARSREAGGTGLGLAIVKHIVQAHGGRVWVQSEPGNGTTFYFTVPRFEAKHVSLSRPSQGALLPR